MVAQSNEGSTLLRDRYRVERLLAHSEDERSVLALDTTTTQLVVVREINIEHLSSWKALELFEREAAVLRHLDHPGVPRLVDSWSSQDGVDVRFGIVVSWIEGTTLADRYGPGDPMSEDEALTVIEGVGEVLRYLHELNPPVVHRDINPSHIVQRGDGTFALVGFGGLQAAIPRTVGGSTFVGRNGFLPPEQLMGRASPASDVYALGATIASLMSGLAADDMARDGMRMKFEEHVPGSSALLRLLGEMLEPLAEDRLRDGAALLRGFAARNDDVALAVTNSPPPPDVVVQTHDRTMRVTLKRPAPPASGRVMVMTLAMSLVIAVLVGVRRNSSVELTLSAFGSAFAFLVVLAALMMALSRMGRVTYVELDDDELRVKRRLRKDLVFRLAELREARRVDTVGNGNMVTVERDDGGLVAIAANTEFSHGTWLAARIDEAIQRSHG